jgi:ribulose-5-phosphate 4-epimerase/fuculose-1-phosphate aldolase
LSGNLPPSTVCATALKTSRTIDDTTRTLEGLKQAQRSGATLTDKQRQQMTDLAAKLDRLKVRRDKETESLRGASEALRRHGVSLAGQTIASAIRRTEQYNQTLERERRQLALPRKRACSMTARKRSPARCAVPGWR